MNNNIQIDFYNTEGEWVHSKFITYKPDDPITPTFMAELTKYVRELNHKQMFGSPREEYMVIIELQSGLSQLTRWVAPDYSIRSDRDILVEMLRS